MAVSEEG